MDSSGATVDSHNIEARLNQIGSDEFKKKMPDVDLSQYEAEIRIEESGATITFIGNESQPGQRGSTGNQPGFEVELANDFRVVRSNFVR